MIVIVEVLKDSAIKLFLVMRGRILFSDRMDLHSTGIEQLTKIIAMNIQKWAKANSCDQRIGKDEIDEAQIIFSYLKSSPCRYMIIPEKWLCSKDKTVLENSLNRFLSTLMEMNKDSHTK
mgnify:CR=1 FL=1